ncbi:uncharacterized protein [Littorina saxatilis]|uniref:uncharacterized protein n=1 Tax=Littorina saxatilis TaxID=31220 RepID=UPI0038B576F6
MATEQQHQHAQLLASFSLGTEHFAVSHDGGSQQDDSQSVDEAPHTTVVDMSGHAVVKLVPDPDTPTGGQPANASPFNLRKKRKIDREDSRNDDYKLIPSKDRGSAKTFDMRRPVRPIDRQKMRPWLKNLLDTGSVFGLNWLQREDGIFQISWRHASRLGWNLETDGDVFERWARHTGIFKDGDEPEPKRWKANFRCALHSLPDVKELTSPTDRKGRNASRTYRFLRPSEVQPPVKRKQRYNIQLPYGVLDRHGSDDSGSQHGESDERNTDEEQFSDQVRAFPHCDHDYAIRNEKSDEEERTSEILSRHNSGYVLIKTKDAHEYEFKLTPTDSGSQPNNSKRPAASPKTPPKQGKGVKKKLTSSSPSKKGKGKGGQQKSPAVKKDAKPVKKMKKSGEKEASPATKVSLKALLSGRKKGAGSKRARAGQPATTQVIKKTRGGKKAGGVATRGKSRKDGSKTGADTSQQGPGGLEALLEAASQIDRMAALTSPSTTAPTTTKSTSVARSKRSAAPVSSSVARPLLQSPPIIYATPASVGHQISQQTVSGVGAPIMFAARHPLVATPVTAGTTFIPVPHTVLAPVTSGAVSVSLPTQVSHSMLQKFLGLSAISTASPVSPVLFTVAGSSAPVQSQSSKASDTLTNLQVPAVSASTTVAGSVKKEEARTHRTVAEILDAPPVPLHMAPAPEAGMSMLKHLLRLTGPGLAASPPTTIFSAPTHTIIPAAPQILTPLVAVLSASEGMPKETIAAETPQVKIEPDVSSMETENTDDNGSSYKILSEYEVGSSQEGQEDSKSFPYIRVSTTKVLVEPEPSTAEETVITSDSVNNPSVSQSAVGSSMQPTQTTASVHSTDSTLVSFTAPLATVSQANAVKSETLLKQEPDVSCHATPSEPQASGSGAQISLTLPPGLLQPQGQLGSGSLAPTVTVTLPPQISIPGSHGPSGSTTTYTQSMDLMQFLNLCAASGNSQVIIKTEAPIGTDMTALGTSFGKEEVHLTLGQTEGDPSASPKFILVDTSLQAPAAVSTAQTEGSQLETAVTEHMEVSAASTTMVTHTETSMSASESMPLADFMQVPQEMTTEEVTSGNSVEVVPNQYTCIMNEGDISSLSEDQQGADSFVVDSML